MPLRRSNDSAWSVDDQTEMTKQVGGRETKSTLIAVVWHLPNPHQSSEESPELQKGEESRKEDWGNLFLAPGWAAQLLASTEQKLSEPTERGEMQVMQH